MNDNATPVFGIDLGTTNTCIAALSPGSGMPEVIANTDSEMVTPSVVFFEAPGNILVGTIAKNNAVAQPELVCSLVKREMSKEGQLARKMTYHGRDYTPEEISSLILRKVVGDALESRGLERDARARAVITVPAYFAAIGKNATKQAGVLAELDVLYVVPEPVAAAVSYGVGRSEGKTTVMVYDLGGGTFDVAVVEIAGPAARVIAFDGERLLGGTDWDTAVVDWIRTTISNDHGVDLPENDAALSQRLLVKAEEAKKALSRGKLKSTFINVEFGGSSYNVSLSNEEFERITAPLLEQTIEKTKAALAAAAERGADVIDRILLVGGSSRMPAVKRRIEQETGLKATLHEPDLAVAKGAALLAGLIETGAFTVDMTGDTDVSEPEKRLVAMLSPKSLGIEVHDVKTGRDIVHYLVPKNSELPASGTKIFGTFEDDQAHILVRIYEERGEESRDPTENILLHETPIELPRGLRAGSPIEVTYRVDDAGILHAFLKEPRSGQTWEISIDKLKNATDEDVLRLRPALESVA